MVVAFAGLTAPLNVVYVAEPALIVKRTLLFDGSCKVTVTPVRVKLVAPATGVLEEPFVTWMIKLLSMVTVALLTAMVWKGVVPTSICDDVKTTGIVAAPTVIVSFWAFLVVLRRMLSVTVAEEFPVVAVAVADALMA